MEALTRYAVLAGAGMLAALVFSMVLLPVAEASHDDDFSAELFAPALSSSIGEARFHWRGSGELSYTITAATGENITSGYLHCGAPPSGGPAVLGLFSRTASSSSPGGFSTSGRITGSGNVFATSTGCAERIRRLADIQDAMEKGHIYIELRSVERPQGAVRGQLMLSEDRDNDDVDDDGSPSLPREEEIWNLFREIERLLDELRSLLRR